MLSLRVRVLSPHPVVCEGVRRMLEPHVLGIRVTGEPHPDGASVREIVVYDLECLRAFGRGTLAAAVAAGPVLGLDRARDPSVRAVAKSMGMGEVVPPETDAVGMVDALRRVSRLDLGRGDDRQVDGGVRLTEREAQVLGLLAQGLNNDEIAARLYLSVNSVKTYLRSAYRRIDVANRAQAAVWWLEHGGSSVPVTPRPAPECVRCAAG